MRIYRDHSFVPDLARGASAAIGNFDGVHRGHQYVIGLARDAGQDAAAPLGVVTFEPHPRQVFQPDAPPFRLMGREARASRLEKIGVERLFELNFNENLAGLTPRAFAQQILHEALGLRHVVVGADFCFGKGRTGNARDLKAFGEEFGFGVTVAPLMQENGFEVSSTAIRQALSDGKPEAAAEMLGHWHRIEGIVIGGEQRGRELGYPTANMGIDGLHPPKFGVYAVLVDVVDGPHKGQYKGAASMGVRPMFGDNKPNLESFLFDFSGDLYGATLSVALVSYLRTEEKFDGLEALVNQMDADCQRAREILGRL